VPAGSKAEEQPTVEDKENDAAAVTAVIWKELAEMSAAQAKLKVSASISIDRLACSACIHAQLDSLGCQGMIGRRDLRLC